MISMPIFILFYFIFFLQKTYPLKLKIIAEKKIIEVGGLRSKFAETQYYFEILHSPFGDVTINADT